MEGRGEALEVNNQGYDHKHLTLRRIDEFSENSTTS